MPYQVWIEENDRRPTKVGKSHALGGTALDMLNDMTDDWRRTDPNYTDGLNCVGIGHRGRGVEFAIIWVEVF